MKKMLLIITIVFTPSFSFADTITLPVKFHLMHDVHMQNMGQDMNVFVSESDIRGVIINEVNRIWKQADIEWKIEEVVSENSLDIANKEQQLQYVATTKRNEEGKSDKSRLPILYSMIDMKYHSDTAYNVYIFPFLGNASQGNANPKKNIVVIGAWSNKSTGGNSRPMKAKLVESEPFKIGSLGRTVAHELGHMLKLKHPDKNKQTEFYRLMGGKKQGYKLTEQEIKRARKNVRFN